MPTPSDALFRLGCGCVLDGYSDSQPAHAWQAGVRNGLLHCFVHGRATLLIDVVFLNHLTER